MNPSDLTAFYSALLVQFLATPAGAAAILLAMVLAVLAVTFPGTRWWLAGAAVWAATLPINGVGYGEAGAYVPLAFPLEQVRLYSRPMTLGFMALLLLPLLTSDRGWRRQLVSWPLMMFFLFEIGIALRLTAVAGEGRGPLSFISYLLLMLSFGLAISMWLKGIDDVYKLLYVICGTSATVIASTCYQLAIDRVPIFYGNRLAGVTGNPQYLGLIISFTLPTACFLLTHARRVWRPLLVLQIAITIIMLLWTGSRTGLLGTALGLTVLFHRRLGRFVIVGVVVGVMVLLALPYFEGSTENAARFLSSENTRAQVWGRMMGYIQESPWFGVSRGDLEVSENSYLAMLGQVGMVGAVPFAVAWVLMAYKVLRLQMARSWLGDQAGLIDLVTAFWVSLAVCAVFEGFLLGVLVFSVLTLYLFAAITTYLSDHVAAVQARQEQDDAEGYGDPWQAAA